MAKRFGGDIEDGGDLEEGRDVHNELIFTSEDIFVIPPMLSIDEKLFQDEVILWSHYAKITTTLRQPHNVSFIYVFFYVSQID